MSWAEKVSNALDKGLHVHSLNEIAYYASDGMKSQDASLAAFVVMQIGNVLANHWHGPIDADYHKRCEAALLPRLKALVDAVIRQAPEDEITSYANRTVQAFALIYAGQIS